MWRRWLTISFAISFSHHHIDGQDCTAWGWPCPCRALWSFPGRTLGTQRSVGFFQHSTAVRPLPLWRRCPKVFVFVWFKCILLVVLFFFFFLFLFLLFFFFLLLLLLLPLLFFVVFLVGIILVWAVTVVLVNRTTSTVQPFSGFFDFFVASRRIALFRHVQTVLQLTYDRSIGFHIAFHQITIVFFTVLSTTRTPTSTTSLTTTATTTTVLLRTPLHHTATASFSGQGIDFLPQFNFIHDLHIELFFHQIHLTGHGLNSGLLCLHHRRDLFGKGGHWHGGTTEQIPHVHLRQQGTNHFIPQDTHDFVLYTFTTFVPCTPLVPPPRDTVVFFQQHHQRGWNVLQVALHHVCYILQKQVHRDRSVRHCDKTELPGQSLQQPSKRDRIGVANGHQGRQYSGKGTQFGSVVFARLAGFLWFETFFWFFRLGGVFFAWVAAAGVRRTTSPFGDRASGCSRTAFPHVFFVCENNLGRGRWGHRRGWERGIGIVIVAVVAAVVVVVVVVVLPQQMSQGTSQPTNFNPIFVQFNLQFRCSGVVRCSFHRMHLFVFFTQFMGQLFDLISQSTHHALFTAHSTTTHQTTVATTATTNDGRGAAVLQSFGHDFGRLSNGFFNTLQRFVFLPFRFQQFQTKRPHFTVLRR